MLPIPTAAPVLARMKPSREVHCSRANAAIRQPDEASTPMTDPNHRPGAAGNSSRRRTRCSRRGPRSVSGCPRGPSCGAAVTATAAAFCGGDLAPEHVREIGDRTADEESDACRGAKDSDEGRHVRSARLFLRDLNPLSRAEFRQSVTPKPKVLSQIRSATRKAHGTTRPEVRPKAISARRPLSE